MSRIGKQPIIIPAGVTVMRDGAMLVVKGPGGELRQAVHSAVRVTIADNSITITVQRPTEPKQRALWGLFRTLVDNMITGVTTGYKRSLEVIGVGYKVAVSGNTVTLNVGYSHPVTVPLPDGVTATVEKNTLTLAGRDKQLVGEVAASIRRTTSFLISMRMRSLAFAI